MVLDVRRPDDCRVSGDFWKDTETIDAWKAADGEPANKVVAVVD